MIDIYDYVKLDLTKCPPEVREYFKERYEDTVGLVYCKGCEEGIVHILWPEGCYLSRPWHEDLLIKISLPIDLTEQE